MPPFRLRKEDAQAVVSYLMSLRPVSGSLPGRRAAG